MGTVEPLPKTESTHWSLDDIVKERVAGHRTELPLSQVQPALKLLRQQRQALQKQDRREAVTSTGLTRAHVSKDMTIGRYVVFFGVTTRGGGGLEAGGW
jgi:hypothetical protein